MSLPHLADYFFICGLDCDLGLEPYLISGDDMRYETYKPPLESAYKARVLQHFPESVPGFGFDAESIATMCMPNGLTLTTQRHLAQEFEHLSSSSSDDSMPKQISMNPFLVTVDDATRYYSVTLHWYEEVNSSAIIEAVAALQAMYDTEEASLRHGHQLSHSADSLDAVQLTFPNVFLPEQDRLFASKSIGVITRHNQLHAFTSWLLDLWRLAQQSAAASSSLERYVGEILSRMTLPLPGHLVAFPGPCGRLHCSYTSTGPALGDFPTFDYPLRGLLDVIGLENLIKVFTCVMLEYRIILISEDCRLLMLIGECVTCLLFPFTWSSAYCPILPRAAKNIVDAPLPLIVGIKRERGTEAADAVELASEAHVCMVDIDHGQVRCSDEVPALPYVLELRNEITRALVDLSEPTLGSGSRHVKSPLVSPYTLAGRNVPGRRASRPQLPTSAGHSMKSAPAIPDLLSMTTISTETQTQMTSSRCAQDAVRVHRLVEEAGMALPWPTVDAPPLANVLEPRTGKCEGVLETLYKHGDYLRYVHMQHVNWVLREVFLNYFLHLFFDYESFLIRRKASELIAPESPLSTEPGSTATSHQAQLIGGFDKLGFLSDQPTTHLDFLSTFLETQMFANFIDAKLLSQWEAQGDPSVALFDARLQERKQLWAQETWRANSSDLMVTPAHSLNNAAALRRSSALLHSSVTPTNASNSKPFWTYRSALENSITFESFLEQMKAQTFVVKMSPPENGSDVEPATAAPSHIQRTHNLDLTSLSLAPAFLCRNYEAFHFPLLQWRPYLRTYSVVTPPVLVQGPDSLRSSGSYPPPSVKTDRGSMRSSNTTGALPVTTSMNSLSRPHSRHTMTPRRSRTPSRRDTETEESPRSLSLAKEHLNRWLHYVQDTRGRMKRQTKVLDMKAGTFTHTHLNFVDLLLHECKKKTKRMVVEKLGQEAVALGHGDSSLSGVEENMLVTGLCDLLERIWSHEIVQKTGKSALWTHLSMYVERQLHRRQIATSTPGVSAGQTHEGVISSHKRPPITSSRAAMARAKEGLVLPDKVNSILKQHSSPRLISSQNSKEESTNSTTPTQPSAPVPVPAPSSIFSALRFDVYSSLQRKQTHTSAAAAPSVDRTSHPASPTHRISGGTLPRRSSISYLLAGGGSAAPAPSSTWFHSHDTASNDVELIDAAMVWEVFGPPKRSLLEDVIAVRNIQQLHSEVAYARAFVRLALEKKLLHAHLERLLQDQELLRQQYKRTAFLRCSEECEQFLFHLLALNAVDYFTFSSTYMATQVTYRVFIYTGRKFSGGVTTSANAWFSLSGVHGCTGKQTIPKGLHKFEFEFHNLGCLTTLRVGHDNSGMSPNWFVEYVLLQNTLTGHVFKFPCNRWIGRSMEDASLERLMIAQQLKLIDEHGNVVPVMDNVSTTSRGRVTTRGNTPSMNNTTSTGFITAPSSRSPSMSRRGSTDARILANTAQAQPVIQERLVSALNVVMKYFHQQPTVRDHHLQAQHLITILCGDQGLVPAVELLMNHGLKSTRFYQKKIYVWDYLERVATYELERHMSLASMQMAREIQDISEKSFSLGKEGKLQRWICRGIRNGALSDWVSELVACPVTAQMYEERAFLAEPTLATNVISLLDVLKDFNITMEPALLGEEE